MQNMAGGSDSEVLKQKQSDENKDIKQEGKDEVTADGDSSRPGMQSFGQRGNRGRGYRGGFDRGYVNRGFRGNRFNRGSDRGHGGIPGRGFMAAPRIRDNRNQPLMNEQPQVPGHTNSTAPEYDQSIWDQNPLDVPTEMPTENTVEVSEPAKPKVVKKFTQRCRLFVGNITPDTTEDEMRKMFEPYGETEEVYLNATKGYGFIRLDYRHNAEAAKSALDGLARKGRTLRIRFAAQAISLRVKNLSPVVSNEMLEESFSQFGEIEKAVIVVDDRGRPTGEGIVEYARKQSASIAYKRITEGVFILTTSPRPVHVEMLSQNDEDDGYPERFIPHNELFRKEREVPPRFAPPGSFEYNFCQRWKRLFEMEKKQEEQMKLLIEEEKLKIESEMENAIMEQHEEMLKQDLMRQQEELRRLQEMRQQNEIRRRADLELKVQNMRASAGPMFDERAARPNRDERGRDEGMRLKEEFRPPHPGIDGMPMASEMAGIKPPMVPPPMVSVGGSQPMQPPPAPPAALQMEMERSRQKGVDQGMHDIPKLMPDGPPPASLMGGAMGFEPPPNPGGFPNNNMNRRSDEMGPPPTSLFGQRGRDKGRPLNNDRRREPMPHADLDMKRSRRF